MKTKSLVVAGLILVASAQAQAYGPYNQQYTVNQQYGSTNWYSSPLGMGVAQAGVALISGVVNKMSQPDPVQQPQPQVIYVNQGQAQQGQYSQKQGQRHPNNGYQYPAQQPAASGGNCQIQTVFDQAGNPRQANICQ
jgi:hypothetical protein